MGNAVLYCYCTMQRPTEETLIPINPSPHEFGNQSGHAVTPRLPIGQLALSINVYPRLVTSYHFYPGTTRQWCEKESLLHESRAKECS